VDNLISVGTSIGLGPRACQRTLASGIAAEMEQPRVGVGDRLALRRDPLEGAERKGLTAVAVTHCHGELLLAHGRCLDGWALRRRALRVRTGPQQLGHGSMVGHACGQTAHSRRSLLTHCGPTRRTIARSLTRGHDHRPARRCSRCASSLARDPGATNPNDTRR
jgi:hypothetical protein